MYRLGFFCTYMYFAATACTSRVVLCTYDYMKGFEL